MPSMTGKFVATNAASNKNVCFVPIEDNNELISQEEVEGGLPAEEIEE